MFLRHAQTYALKYRHQGSHYVVFYQGKEQGFGFLHQISDLPFTIYVYYGGSYSITYYTSKLEYLMVSCNFLNSARMCY